MGEQEVIPHLEADQRLLFPVVGIGASAGGLEACTEVFHHLDADPGMAFVLVLHLDPNHESLMAELLSRKTCLPVKQIAHGDLIEAGTIHVIPPGAGLTLKNGRFKLRPFNEPRGLRRPIDSFFVSLARSQGENAACVILSGTGADGSFGLRAIKEMGGVCVAQDLTEARYDGMPASAMATSLVDFVMPASEIVERLRQYFNGSARSALPEDASLVEKVLHDIFHLLREETGHDFSGYKRSTIIRRLERRLQVLGFSGYDDYIEFLRGNPDERKAVFEDMLINVTSFFRDVDHFTHLRDNVIVPLVAGRKSSDEIRIWVPGCSTGQEAFTLAMILDEVCDAYEVRPLIQIFATDIDAPMIDQARLARYPLAAFEEIPAKYQSFYTVGQDGHFEIVKRIREMVRFSTHNLLSNAPFSRMDLISCRNLMIYFKEDVQREVLQLFHFSLRDNGHLFLGASENVTRREDLFEQLDVQSRIFVRKATRKRKHILLPIGSALSGSRAVKRVMPQERNFPRHERLEVTNQLLYEHYAPPFARIAPDGRIVSSSGDLSLYLMSRPGDQRNVYQLARDGLSDVIVSAVTEATDRNGRVAYRDLEISSQFGVQVTDLVAHPMKDGTIALIFFAKDRLQSELDEFTSIPPSRDQRISELQEEVQAAQLQLRTKVVEIETANEELKSSNEEMMSMNEELQSANEELTTANEELKNKIDELSVANADLDNFMQSSAIVMIVLDRAMRIRHLTDAAMRLFPFQESDRGRSIGEFRLDLDDADLAAVARDVLDDGKTIERSVHRSEGAFSYVLRATPHFFGDGSIAGVTVTLVDVSELMELRDDLRLEGERFKLAVLAGAMGIAEMDTEHWTVSFDQEVSRQMGLQNKSDCSFARFCKNVSAKGRTAFEDAVSSGQPYDIEFSLKAGAGETRWVRARGLPYLTRDGQRRILNLSQDISEQRNFLEEREVIIREMSHRVKNLFAVLSALVQSMPKLNDDTRKFAEELTIRIAALGSAYDLARKQEDISGVDLEELIRRLLKPHVSKQMAEVTGPKTFIGNRVLTTLTLVLNELATNAFKYGALSDDEGRISVTWDVTKDGLLDLLWKETMPEFDPKEIIPGFGSKLIEIGAKQLNATFDSALGASGFEMRMSFLIKEIE